MAAGFFMDGMGMVRHRLQLLPAADMVLQRDSGTSQAC
jgi:hypothetical protein